VHGWETTGVGDESREERLDRELIELLNELRVLLPGVQVLFAFLLTVPFATGFSKASDFQKDTYLFTLLCTALGSALLIAPSSYHRLRFRDYDKERLLRTSNRLAIAGTVLLALAMSAAVLLVTDYLFADVTTGIVTGLVVAAFAWFWFGLPLVRKARD
jgi:O-antigen/teichoic acid export membrane protein